MIQRKKPTIRASTRLAGGFLDRSPGPAIAEPPIKKRGRPRLGIIPFTPKERKRRERITKAERQREAERQAEIDKIKQEQEIDDKTGGRGSGMYLSHAPQGKGKILFGVVEGLTADALGQLAHGKNHRWRPQGTGSDFKRRPFKVHEGKPPRKSRRPWHKVKGTVLSNDGDQATILYDTLGERIHKRIGGYAVTPEEFIEMFKPGSEHYFHYQG